MSDVITLGSIEMYGLVTVWTSMDDGPYWVLLLIYGSHDMRHTGFRRLTVVNGTLRFHMSPLSISVRFSPETIDFTSVQVSIILNGHSLNIVNF